MALVIFTTPFTGLLVTTFAAPTLSQHQIAPEWIAIALSLGSFLAIFTQRNAIKVEQIMGKKWGLLFLVILPAVSWGLLAVVSGGMVWLIIVWMYATNGMSSPLLSGYQNTLIPDQNRATTLSLMNMFNSLFISIMSPLYAGIGIPIAFLLIGGVILVAGILLRA